MINRQKGIFHKGDFFMPKTIRSKILISTAIVTAALTTLTVSVCFSLFQTFLRQISFSLQNTVCRYFPAMFLLQWKIF